MAMVRLFNRQSGVASGTLLFFTSSASAFVSIETRSFSFRSQGLPWINSSVLSPSPSQLYEKNGCSIDSSNQTRSKHYKPKPKVDPSGPRSGKGRSKKNKGLFRADKVLSTRASITRSKAHNILKQRRVAFQEKSQVDGQLQLIPIKGPKDKLPMNAVLWMDGKPIDPLPPILIAFHKPKNVLSAMEEKHSKKDHLGMFLSEQYKKLGMHPVGRLDYDSSGLLLFTTEGKLTQRLLHPKHGVEKEYTATVSGGSVDAEELTKQLEIDGVVTGEGTHKAKLLNIELVSLEDSEAIKKEALAAAKDKGDEEMAIASKMELPLTNIRLSVQEGKYRMVRRMLANCNHPVIELKRESFGAVKLRDLPVGEFGSVDESEIEWAEDLLGLKK